MKRVLFRVDAGSKYGLGHLSRCFALAQQILEKNIQIKLFINGDLNEEIAYKLSQNRVEIKLFNSHTINEFENEISKDDIVVIDSYEITDLHELNYKQKCKKLIVIDDFKDRIHSADAVINTSVSTFYNRANNNTKYFLGLEYALLRKEFLATFHQNDRKGILISMGGSDPKNITVQLLKILFEMPINEPIHVIYTNSYSIEQNNTFLNLNSLGKIHTHYLLEPEEVANLMDKCKYGIFPASNILLEGLKRNLICAFGYYTDNQIENYNNLLNYNAGVKLEEFSNNLKDNLANLLLINEPNYILSKIISSKLNELVKYIIDEP